VSTKLTGRRAHRRTFIVALAACASATALAVAAPGPAAVDYAASGGATMAGVRPTAVGLPQIGATGTVGAGDLGGALRGYHDSGAYDQDLATVGAAAKAYLDARLAGETPPTTGTTGDGATGDGAGATGTTPTTTAGTTTTGATPRCAVRYLRIKRPKGKAALYRRRQTCPKAKTKSKAKAKASAAPAKPAIVLDIDETSLSNYDGLVATGFSSAGTAIPAAAGTGTAIAPILALYRDARAKGVAVFFVTGRPSAIAQVTAENLRSAGYTAGWDGLQFKPTDQTTVAFKAGARAAVEQRGYDIVLDAGDQESDLDGGHADRLFKLPNPYYFIAD
jgi:hypothetical protein